MKRRKGIIALIAATAGLGVAAIPACAELHSVTVVLITGERIQVHRRRAARHAGQPGRRSPASPARSSRSSTTARSPRRRRARRGAARADRPRRPQGAHPHVDPHAGRQREARRAQPDARATREPDSSTRAREGQGNQTFARRQHQRQEARRQARARRAQEGAPRRPQPGRAARRRADARQPELLAGRRPAPPRSACRTSSSTSSASRRSCSRIYQAAGIEYGVRWEVLAAINEIETDYGRNLNVSSAGALGWMQFMPATWKQYGVDANKDELKDPYNPVDAIFAAARYLKAAGAEQDLRKAIFAYNHADWYVDSVLMRARMIGGLPANFVGSLTGLTQGHFPVAAKATYADDLSEREAKKLSKRSRKKGNRALVVEGSKHRRGIKIFARRGAPVIAVNDGKVIARRREPSASAASSSSRTSTATPTRTRAWPRSPRPTPRRASARRRARPSPASSRCPPRTPSRPRPPPPPRSARPSARKRRQARTAGPPQPPARRAAATKQRLFAQPGAPEGRPRRRRAAAVRAHRQDRRRLELQVLLHEGLRPQPQGRPDQEAAPGLAHRRRHDPRPHRQDLQRTVAARAVRDPPGRPRRPAHRPEADPRRLEAARVDRDLPRRRQEPVLRPGRQDPVDRPDPADEQGGAGPARPRQPAHRALRLRPRRHPHRPDRPPRAGDARVPRRLRPPPDRHLAEVRPRLPDRVGQRLRTTPPATPSTSPRSTASRSWATRARARSPSSPCSAC